VANSALFGTVTSFRKLHNFVRRIDGYVSEDSLHCDMNEWEQQPQ